MPKQKTNPSVLTPAQFQRALPKQFRQNVTDTMVDHINQSLTDTGLRENFRDNLLGFTSVMRDGRFKMGQYVNAVKYVSHKLLGGTNIDAYVKTFPDKYQHWLSENLEAKVISKYVAAYNGSKLVQLIYEQTLTPTHVLNADLYQRAINTQAAIMTDPNASYKVQSDAANSLLTHLKPPETQKIELDIGIKQDKSIDELRATTMQLVKQQENMLALGQVSAKDVAHSQLLIEDGEVVDD